MKLPKYPLEQLLLIKERRLEEAEKRLKEKKLILAKELEKLKKLEQEAQLTHDHMQDKVKQLDEEMNQGTYSHKIDTAHKYIKVVEDQLKQKKKKVTDQDKVVQTASQQVEIARKDLLKTQQDVEKLKIHKTEWKQGVMKELDYKEALEGDEIGSAKHLSLKREKEDREQYKQQRKKKE
jgi:hypothetical protein